jgi:ABC-type multidrug transport system fused ATPase/permease subunit
MKSSTLNLFDLRRNSIGIAEMPFFSNSIKSNIKFGKEDASMDEVIAAAKNAVVHETSWALTSNMTPFWAKRNNIIRVKTEGFHSQSY